jgi:hypothetical protein
MLHIDREKLKILMEMEDNLEDKSLSTKILFRLIVGEIKK